MDVEPVIAQAESSNHLFALQTKELVNEVKRSKNTKTEKELHRIKEIIESLPDQQFDQQYIESLNAPLHNNPSSNKKLAYKFKAPIRMQVIGSYLIQTVCEPILNVDLALEIPPHCLTGSDVTNYAYQDKRTIYIYHVAKQLATKEEYKKRIYFEAFRGNVYKPILCLQAPTSKKRSKIASFVIRIHTTTLAKNFKLNRLVPTKANISNGDNMSDIEAPQASPFANTEILEDIFAIDHLSLLNVHLSQCKALTNAIILFKVWLRQREYEKSSSNSFNGFLISMLMVYLLKTRQLNNQMTSYQIFRVTMFYLANSAFDQLQKGISLDEKADITIFRTYYEVIFLDGSGLLNLTAGVRKSNLLEIQHDAKLSIKLLDDQICGFQTLFLSKVPFAVKLDQYFIVRDIKNISNVTQNLGEYPDENRNEVVATRMRKVVEEAFGTRVSLVLLHVAPLPAWTLKKKYPTNGILVGSVAVTEQMFESIIRGPAADLPEAERFRQLWGEKADLWQMTDGSLVEAVQWEVTSSMKHTLFEQQVAYLFGKHFQVNSDSIQVYNQQLDAILESHPYAHHKQKSTQIPSALEESDALLRTFDELKKMLSYLPRVPLRVHNVHRNHPALANLAHFVPRKHPLLDIPVRRLYASSAEHFSRYVEPIGVLIELEESKQWPDDYEAIQNLKAAFYVMIERELRNEHELFFTAVSKEHIDVTIEGFVFRIQIIVEKEISLMEQQISIEQANKRKIELYEYPRHLSAMRSIPSSTNCFPNIVRLAKYWIHSHLLAEFISDPVVELLVAALFCPHRTGVSVPSGHLVGFLRFLQLLATFDFHNQPLVVDVDAEISSEQLNSILHHFNKIREQPETVGLCPLYLATPRDMFSSHWSKEQPSSLILQRVTALAKQSIQFVLHQFESSVLLRDSEIICGFGLTDWKQWRSLFVPPKSDYDVCIVLQSEYVPHRSENVLVSKQTKRQEYKEAASSEFYHASVIQQRKNKVKRALTVSLPMLFVGLHPVSNFVKQLNEHFSQIALFFYGDDGSNEIGVIWKPTAFLPQLVRTQTLQYAVPYPNNHQTTRAFVIRSIFEIVSDIRQIGGPLISDIVFTASVSHKF